MAESDKRLRYFNGQFLQEQDFTDEQQYHLDRQRRHNRLLHSYGIADGLAVTAEIGAGSVTVHPGTAIDKDGRTIVLTEPRNLDFESAESRQLLVVIAYSEEPSDPARVGDAGNTRWFERPEVQVISETEALAEDVQIRLARLHLDESWTVAEHDKSVRRSAGKLGAGTLEVQKPIGDAAQFIQDQNGTRSSLAIGTRRVEISTDADQEAALTVVGKVSNAPLVTLHSKKNESSIRYSTEDKDRLPWHVGTGGHGGLDNFFFWNERKGVVAKVNPEGTLTVNNLATPDGRNLKTDRDTLDALNSATLEGVSNPGGNIDLIGENGITVTGDNAANTIRISNAAGSLTVLSGIKDEPALVQDQAGIPSALKIGKNIVEIKTEVERHVVLKVTGKTTNGPVEELHSTGNESSIRYSVAGSTVPWHVGTGGLGGDKNFFFWNESNGIIAQITPDGTLTAAGFATPDGRDIKTDRDTLDALKSATLEGVSNPGGNIDLIGENGITVTGDNAANTIRISNATGNLVIPNGIKDEPAPVQDQTGIPSSLKIGKDIVEIKTEVERHVVLKVTGKTTNGPVEELHSTGNESSIRYSVAGGMPWHVGTGGLVGPGRFFFWNDTNGAVATIEADGTLTARGSLNVGGGTKGTTAFTAESDNLGATVEVRNKQEEATIKYVGKNNVPWNVGTGGASGAENFFFRAANVTVATMTPDGSTTVKGTLNAGGGTKNTLVMKVEGDHLAAPILEVHNKQNEASIRYWNLKDKFAWHAGTGGGGGEKNFFFWSQTHGIVWTIEPSGAPTMKGIPHRSTAIDSHRLKPLLVDPITGKIYYGD